MNIFSSKKFRNLAAYWFAFLFVAAISFFLSPFVVRHLGNTAYGVWTLLASLIGYLGLLDFGVRGTITRYIAHHYAAGKTNECSSIISAGLILFGILGIVAIVVALFFAYFAPSLFNIPPYLIADTRTILVVGGLTVAVTLIGAVFGGVVAGLERFDIGSGIDIAVTAMRTVAVVYALNEGFGLVALAFIHFASSMLTGFCNWIAAAKLLPDLSIRFSVSLRPQFRKILSFSVLLSAIHVLSALIYYSDALIIAAFLPIGMVTFFAIAANLCDYARQVASALSVMITPRVSAMASMGSNKIVDEILSSARFATLITGSIAFVFWFRGEAFINLWMGSDYGPAAGEILRILAFVVMIGGGRSVATASIIGVNKHRNLIKLFAFEATFNVALSVALVSPLGLAGVALGTLIPSSIVGVWYFPRILEKATGVPAAQFYFKAWFLPILACTPFGVVSFALERYCPARSLAVFFGQVALSLPLVAAFALVICFNMNEKKQVHSSIKALLIAITRK